MTDQIPADKVRKLAARFRQQMEPHTPFAEGMVWERAAEAVETLLPAPPTLADMIDEERAACRRMQADVEGRSGRYVIAALYDNDADVALIGPDWEFDWIEPECVTPRPDLPRMAWPGDQEPAPAPAPALPDGWRLADHADYGRVVVTRTDPDDEGEVAIIRTLTARPSRAVLTWCDPDELTYIDQEADTVPPDTLAVGTVIESADDPRIAALPVGSILLDRDGEATTKLRGDWTGPGYIPIEGDGGEYGPWTVLHIPKEADQ